MNSRALISHSHQAVDIRQRDMVAHRQAINLVAGAGLSVLAIFLTGYFLASSRNSETDQLREALQKAETQNLLSQQAIQYEREIADHRVDAAQQKVVIVGNYDPRPIVPHPARWRY